MSLLCVLSCAKSKKACISEYEYYINKIDNEHASYDERKWAKVNKRLDNLQNKIKRYEKKLTTDDKKRIRAAFKIYAKYRKDITLPFTEDELASTGNDGNNGKDKSAGKARSVDTDDKLEELKKITAQQQEIFLQLQQLRQQIEDDSSIGKGKQKTEKELLINELENDLLMKVLQEKKEGRCEVHGRIKVLVFPTNFRGEAFRADIEELEDKIEKAMNVIRREAKKYREDIFIDYEIRTSRNGSYISLSDSDEALNRYKEYSAPFNDYDHVSIVYALDVEGRSYCSLRGGLGKNIANAVMWYKWNDHSAGTLAHELFHTFGADDLYYEEGVVPKEVEDNFHKLLGDSIMIMSNETNSLDPINAWLIGWNNQPEAWYAWFVDRRKSLDVDW